MASRTKSAEKSVVDIYLERLQDHLSIETKTIETVLSELPVCACYETLNHQMRQDLDMRRAHAEDIKTLLDRHGQPIPATHETVSSILNTVSSLFHNGEDSDLLKGVLTNISYRSYQVASLDILLLLAGRLGFVSDIVILKRLHTEENISLDLLRKNFPDILTEYLSTI
ncbi:DUF892 family protein [Gluconobacter japonicus]|uniref:DUF892 family protein n=1 Tax=Gluconobacter japonicus TaxID=376620 RepID=UPI001B8B2997|nr:DUF892 family protein [Gluconobacter japonicus]MBS1049806.1 DUF892 family protein [Gluconobacter japonicus]